jgi:signal transduction histidine kinase
MSAARSRFSPLHVAALATFLVPLAILAALGWSELRQSGAAAEAALTREGEQFLLRARQATEQRLEQLIPAAFESTRAHLETEGPVRTALRLSEQEDFAALRSIVLLDEQGGVVWPPLPLTSVYLPLAREPQRQSEAPVADLVAIDLLLQLGRTDDAIRGLQQLVRRLEIANPPGPDRRPGLVETEANARFRLATALRKSGRPVDARGQLELVRQTVAELNPRFNAGASALGLLAETTLAELGEPADRLRLLRALTENQREVFADGLTTALARRLAATFAGDDPDRAEVDRLLREEERRAGISSFATAYEQVVKPFVVLRRLRHALQGETPFAEATENERLIVTIGGDCALVCIRPATPAEASRWRCTSVALHFDLRELLGPTWAPFRAGGGTFVLAVHDPDDLPILPPPAADPTGFAVPTQTTNDLELSAYPADPTALRAAADASATTRTLLIVALFLAALGGALWSWRSVTREAELAALKIDLVSRVSHELKTPLALVRMYGETLSLGRVRDEAQAAEFGGIIARESERLTQLIQRILDFSRQQAGTLTYAATTFDLGQRLRRVVEDYSAHLAARGVFVVDDLPSDLRVHCDQSALESAIVNLLENAAKYGRDGESEHEIELALTAADGMAVVEVRDHGRGIPPGEHERIFDGFYRATNAGEARGAGLGLNLVRHFARAHGGDITALPRDGGGTVMRLLLPLAPDTTTMAAADAPHDS